MTQDLNRDRHVLDSHEPSNQLLLSGSRYALAIVATLIAFAARLGVSAKTVEAHRGAIMARLGIRDLAGLVRFAIRVGLVEHDR